MIHIATCSEPFLEGMLTGIKFVETRWSNNKAPPYGRVRVWDVIKFKHRGYLVGEATVQHAWSWESQYAPDFGKAALIDNWDERKAKYKYLTMIWLQNPQRYVTPVRFTGPMRPTWILEPSDRSILEGLDKQDFYAN